jgi:4-amino-4-deoxychorismate lyase
VKLINFSENPIPLEQNRAFLYGDGLFTTMRCYENTFPFLDDHMERLHSSLQYFYGYDDSLSDFLKEIKVKVFENLSSNGRLRISFFRSLENEIYYYFIREDVIGNWKKMSEPYKVKTSSYLKTSQNIIPSNLKLGSYALEFFMKDKAKSEGLDDLLFFDQNNYMVDSTVCSVFVEKEGGIITPKPSSTVLDGIVKKVLMEKVNIREVDITAEDLAQSKEIFLTNSVRGVIPVSKIDDRNLNHWNSDSSLTRSCHEVYCLEIEKRIMYDKEN